METAALVAETVAWRRHLHANAELGFREHETSRFVRETLESFGGLESASRSRDDARRGRLGE